MSVFTMYTTGCIWITELQIVIMYICLMHCIYLSDWLLVSAYIWCLIWVIGILAKSCIGTPLIIAIYLNCQFAFY